MLRPGGVLLFAGEPSRHGDRIAALPEARRARRGPALAPCGAARARPQRATAAPPDDHALESLVDVHAFTPAELERHATAAGFAAVRVRGEELLANMFGWFNRTVEASAVHGDIPHGWFRYAYRGYILLQKLDTAVLEPHLPAAGFYNLMLTARKPEWRLSPREPRLEPEQARIGGRLAQRRADHAHRIRAPALLGEVARERVPGEAGEIDEVLVDVPPGALGDL